MPNWYQDIPPQVYWPAGLISWFAWGLALYLIAKKTRTEPAWLGWVPILQWFLLLSIAELSCLWAILLLVPCVNFFVLAYLWWRVCERRRKPGVLGLFMLIPGVNLIVAFYLGLSD